MSTFKSMLNCMHEIGLTCLLPNKISAVHCFGINQHCILDNSPKRPALLSPNTTWILQDPKRRRCVFRCFCHSKSGDFVLHEWNAFLTSVGLFNTYKWTQSMLMSFVSFSVFFYNSLQFYLLQAKKNCNYFCRLIWGFLHTFKHGWYQEYWLNSNKSIKK